MDIYIYINDIGWLSSETRELYAHVGSCCDLYFDFMAIDDAVDVGSSATDI